MKKLFDFRHNLLLLLLAGLGIGAQAYEFDWVKGISGSGEENSYSTVGDHMGNVYVGGYYSSATLDLNPGGTGGVINNTSGYDGFVAKYDAGGNFLWVKNIVGSADDNVDALAVDPIGNVFVLGTFYSASVDLNPGGTGGSVNNADGDYADIFLGKYAADGTFQWAKALGGTGTDAGGGLAVDDAGNAYITGNSNSTDADFNPGGSGGTIGNAGANDAFLAKYDTDGTFLWAKNFGGASNDYGWSVALDGAANVYITGRHSNAADFNIGGTGGVVNSQGNVDAYVAKYDTDGNFQWVNTAGGTNIDFPLSVAADAVGNVYFTGYSRSNTVSFDPAGSVAGQTSKIGTHSGFLAAYDSAGAFRWVKSIGGAPGYTQPTSVTVSGTGKVYLTGWFTVPVVDFDALGGGTGTTAPKPGEFGTNALFLAEYETNGDLGWTKTVGGTAQYGGSPLAPGVQPGASQSVSVDGRGSLYVSGWFKSDAADFNAGGTGGELTSVVEDGFLMKFACNDTSSSVLTVSSCEEDYTWNDSVYTTSGTYVAHFYPNAVGCDSMVTLELELTPVVKPHVNVNGFVLGISGNVTYASYQWLKEDELIPGATEPTFEVSSNGDYRVVVSNEQGCVDTSDVYTVNNYPTDIENVRALQGLIQVYPNPATDVVYIQSPVQVNIRITDMAGRLIKEQLDASSVSVEDLPKGVYLMNIADKAGMSYKVVKLVLR